MGAPTMRLNLLGDVMLGRLIDQMFPQHVDEPEEAAIAKSFLSRNPNLSNYGPSTPWGDTLELLQQADLNLINLETSATTHSTKWPDKVFNYRMHPANISALKAANVHYAGLANNHTLDFDVAGLLETVQTVKKAGIAFAGAGQSLEEVSRPAILELQGTQQRHQIRVWAASDHPSDWATVPLFHSIDYSEQTRSRLKRLIGDEPSAPGSLRVFSVHWGPNYAWQPADEIRQLAHFLVDECGIDIVHGHSSHHVQGVERYTGKLIIYGCGDFVDDYALTPGFRNDLSAVWSVVLQESEGGDLKLRQLEIYPTKIEKFAARRLTPAEKDGQWVRQKIVDLSSFFDTNGFSEFKGHGGFVLQLQQ